MPDVPRILQVGTAPHKNLTTVAQALKGEKVVLDILGPLSPHQLEMLRTNEIRFTNYTNLHRQEVAELYRRADAVVFASTYEGFGMPILEAQATGRPIVTSDISPLTEIGADAACFVQPDDSISIKRGLQRVLSCDGYREKLITAGLRNAAKYDATSVARQYIALYEEIYRNSSAWTLRHASQTSKSAQ